jgi:hypothetical protein
MSTVLPLQDNDTRGWVLVHEDPIGAQALVDWWMSFSRSTPGAFRANHAIG